MSVFVNTCSSTSTMYFQYIHLPVWQLPVRVLLGPRSDRADSDMTKMRCSLENYCFHGKREKWIEKMPGMMPG